MPEARSPRRYTVFISYRHADNVELGRKWANWLHEALESYEVPADLVGQTNQRGEVIPASLYPVFRDEQELPADADLSLSIQRALENSALLVVLCSPRAAQSRFVADEIRCFKELGKSDRILALMIDGEPNASDDPAKVKEFGAAQECFPEPLRFGVPAEHNPRQIDWSRRTEPIAADVRPGGRPEQGWTAAAAYREWLERRGLPPGGTIRAAVDAYAEQLDLARLKVVAGACGLPLGVLTQRDKAHQLARARRRATLLRRWLVAVGALGVLAGLGGVVAWGQMRRAHAAEARTVEQLRETRRQLERAQLEEGRAWLARARTARESMDNYNALLLAGRATGFIGYGRSGEMDVSPRLLGAKFTADPVAETLRGQARAEVERFISAGQPSMMPLWSSPILAVVGGGFVRPIWSPDGTRLLAVADQQVNVWNAATGQLISTCAGHTGKITDLALSRDGQTIASASEDLTVRTWDAATGRELRRLAGHAQEVSAVCFCPEGGMLASASRDRTIQLWDLQTGGQVASLTSAAAGVSLTTAQAGRVLLAGTRDGTIERWDLVTRERLSAFKVSRDPVWQLAVSPDQRFIAARGGTDDLRVLEAESGQPLPQQPGQGYLGRVAFSPDSSYLAVCHNERLETFDLATGQLSNLFGWHGNHGFSEVVFRPDGRQLVTVGAVGRTLRRWDTASHRELPRTTVGHDHRINRVLYSSDGSFLVTRSWDQTIKVWDAATGELLKTLTIEKPGLLDESLAMAADGAQIACFDEAGGVLHWNLLTGAARTYPLPDEGEGTFIAFTPNCRLLVIHKEKRTRPLLLDLASGETGPLLDESARCGPVMALSANGHYLAASIPEADGIQLWDFRSNNKAPLTLSGGSGGCRALQFSADERFLMSAHDSQRVEIRNLDGSRPKPLCTLFGHEQLDQHLALSPDGSLAATLEYEKDLRLWDTATGQVIARFRLEEGELRSMAFSADGKQLAVGCQHGTLKVLDVARSSEVVTLRNALEKDHHLAWSRDGRVCITSGKYGTSLWDAATGRELANWHEILEDAQDAAFSPDGRYVATVHDGGTVRIIEARTGLVTKRLAGHKETVTSVAWSADGTRLATGSAAGAILIWDTTTWTALDTLPSQKDGIIQLAFCGAHLLASGTKPGEVKLWDVVHGGETRTLPRPTDSLRCLATSQDGTWLAIGTDDGVVRLWEAATARLQASWTLENRPEQIAFHPAGSMLAVSSEGALALFDVPSGGPLTEVGHLAWQPAVAFSPDGEFVGATGREQTVQFWRLADLLGPSRDDLLRPQRAGLIAVENGTARWRLNDTLFTERAFAPIHLRGDFSAHLADSALTPAQRMTLRLQQAAQHEQWRLAGTLWSEARTAHLAGDPAVRGAFLLQLGTTARGQATTFLDTGVPVFETDLWKSLLDTLQPADFADSRLELVTIGAVRQLIKRPATNQAVLDDTLARLPACITPGAAEAIAQHLANEAAAYDARPDSKEAGTRLIRALADHHATSGALQRSAFKTCLPTDGLWRTYLDRLLALPDATEAEYSGAAYKASQNPDLESLAKDLIKRTLARFAQEEHAHRLAGWTWLNLSDLVSARAAFQKSMALLKPSEKPGRDVLAGLSVVTWRLGETEAALDLYLQLIQTGRAGTPPFDYTLAETITKLGWSEAERTPLEELRAATLARHPELAKSSQ